MHTPHTMPGNDETLVDRLVYESHDLTDDEIAIVEEGEQT